MNPKTLPRLTLLLLLFLLFSIARPAQAEEPKLLIQGVVTESLTGNPIHNATVIISDLINYMKETVTTDAQGRYTADVTVDHTYRLYAYYNSSKTPGLDTVPVKSIDIKISEPVTNLNFSLYPGASIVLQGSIYYLGSRGRYTTYVVDPTTGEPPILNNTKANFTNVLTWGSQRETLDLGFNQNIAVIPAGIPVDLRIRTTALVRDPLNILAPPHSERILFPVDNNTVHYTLLQGELANADLSWYSLLKSANVVNDYYDRAWKQLVDMEKAGFYLGRLKEDMDRARKAVEQAQELMTNGSYQQSLDALGAAYSIVTVEVAINMQYMWLTAQSSAIFMPLFPAFFAVTAAFFLFEKINRKILFSCIFYGIFFAALYYVYPGFQIVDLKYLLLLASLALALALFLSFGMPRLIKEPDIPGAYPFRAVLSVVFSMAKRNVKRRLSRGVLAIASLTILVLAFTAFTSFGTALGLMTTRINIQPPYEGMLIKNLPPPLAESKEPYLPIDIEEVEWLRDQTGVKMVSPLVWNSPKPTALGLLRGAQGQELLINGILGIDPSPEANLTQIETYVSGSLHDLEKVQGGVIISQGAANQLGAQKGHILPFYLYTSSGLQFYSNVTLVGIINDGGLSGLTDLDGKSLLSFRIVGGNYVTVGAAETLILYWSQALQIPNTAISRIAFQMEAQGNIEPFARSVVMQKDYNVWTAVGGVVTWYHFGDYFEIGGVTLLFPLFIVLLNLGLVMISIVSERSREIFTLTCIGFNPTHIAALFLAESVVMGLVGGGLGYLLGMSSYRLMTFLSVDIAVRQKLEWYWSAIGVLLSVGAAILSAIRPASRAAMKVTPSLVKKVKLEGEKEKTRREEDMWKAYQAQKIAMPVRIHEGEMIFFSSYLSSRLQGMKRGLFERVEDYSEADEETPEGDQIKRLLFTYTFLEAGVALVTVNELLARKRSKDDYYSLSLESKPKTPGLPMTFLDRTIRLVRDILGDWQEEKPRIMGKM